MQRFMKSVFVPGLASAPAWDIRRATDIPRGLAGNGTSRVSHSPIKCPFRLPAAVPLPLPASSAGGDDR